MVPLFDWDRPDARSGHVTPLAGGEAELKPYLMHRRSGHKSQDEGRVLEIPDICFVLLRRALDVANLKDIRSEHVSEHGPTASRRSLDYSRSEPATFLASPKDLTLKTSSVEEQRAAFEQITLCGAGLDYQHRLSPRRLDEQPRQDFDTTYFHVGS